MGVRNDEVYSTYSNYNLMLRFELVNRNRFNVFDLPLLFVAIQFVNRNRRVVNNVFS